MCIRIYTYTYQESFKSSTPQFLSKAAKHQERRAKQKTQQATDWDPSVCAPRSCSARRRQALSLLPPQTKGSQSRVREAYPEALEAITTLIRQPLGGWARLQEAVVQSTRARLHNTASSQLSFVSVDGKSAEVQGIIAALVQLLFDFQVKICVHVHAWAAVFLTVTSGVSCQVEPPDRSKHTSNLVLLWSQNRENAAYGYFVI